MLLVADFYNVWRLLKEPLGFAGHPQKIRLLAGFVFGHRTHSFRSLHSLLLTQPVYQAGHAQSQSDDSQDRDVRYLYSNMDPRLSVKIANL